VTEPGGTAPGGTAPGGTALRWRRSPHSGSTGGQCVEVAAAGNGMVGLRDSKDPGGPVLRFTLGEWRAFLAHAKHGAYDFTTRRGGRAATGRPHHLTRPRGRRRGSLMMGQHCDRGRPAG
jgi:hypothetical protein